MSLLFSLLQVRLKQVYRMLYSIGLGVLLILVPLAFLGVLMSLQFLWTTPAPWGGLLLSGSLLRLHYQRGDRFFLEQLTHAIGWIYVVEYVLAASPVLVFFVYWGQWWNVLVAAVGLLFLVVVRPPYGSRKSTRLWSAWFPVDWVPLFLWEWRSGLRQQGWWMVLMYGAGLFGTVYTAATPALTLLFALAVCLFYQAVAPKEILQASNTDGHFLRRKIRQSVGLFHLLLLPQYILFLFFQSRLEVLLGILVLACISTAWISFSICLQYHRYTYESEHAQNLLLLGIFVGGSLVPFLWPLLPFLWWHYWRKAQKQLNYYA